MGVVKMQTKGILLYFLSLCGLGLSKICWEACSGDEVVQNVDIEGCRRRSSYPLQQDFRCEGKTGPPCTVVRGDVVYLDVTWEDSGHTNLTQAVYWQMGYGIEVPWVGMETEICQYINDGEGCPKTGETSVSRFRFPIKILEVYPAGYYNLKWSLVDRTPQGDKTALCFLYPIK